MADAHSVPPAYPTRWETDAVLADGSVVHVRPVRPDDAARIDAFHARQSRESIYFRYFTPMPKLSARELERLTSIDYVTRMAFVALEGDDIVAMASYDVWRAADEAEVAFIVDDAHQGRGLATVLLEYLIVAARENGLRALTAQVLPSNRRMLSVFHNAGFAVSSEFDEGVIKLRLGLEPTERATALIEERERLSEARSIQRLLFPGSVAVIGAGREPGGIGHEVFRNLLTCGFEGPVYPVNPSGGHVSSVRSYPSVLDIPDEVDLAVVCVPAQAVERAVKECARKRVRGLVIMSAGFEGLEIEGRPAERVLAERALRAGMRLIGPESMGVINTAPSTRLVATFADVRVDEGPVGMLTQSGTLGIAALRRAHRMGIGVSVFVDIGSRPDVSGNDLLQFWSSDDRTKLALLYLESFGNPRKFTRIARRMAREKPIVAVKAGRTGRTDPDADRLGLGPWWPADATVDALLSQSGVIRVDTPARLFDVARVLVNQPVPRGRRVAVVSNSRGSTLLTVDACLHSGLELAPIDPTTQAALAALLPAGAEVANPVELTWQADASHYEAAVRAVLQADGVDAALVVYAPAVEEHRAKVARALGLAARASAGKPVLAAFLSSEVGVPLIGGEHPIPLFEFPDEAAAVLGTVVDYGAWLAEDPGTVPVFEDLDLDAIRACTTELLGEGDGGGRWLDRADAMRLLALAGLPVARERSVGSVEEAVAAAAEIGFPVALKASGVPRYQPGEAGGVALDLHDEGALRAAYQRMCEHLGEAMRPALVQQQVPTGAGVMVGGHQHAAFGAVIALGIGGAMSAARSEVSVRVLPLTDADADRLIAASPVASLLEGAPGEAAGSPGASCRGFLLRLAAVLEAVPEIADVVLNPLIVGAEGAWVVDASVRVAPYRWDPAPPVRRVT
ncbi:bifunctional acetate--CoA ligase family protein/GNAT family N-acetyltransferase [Rhabdothermincola sediminis]|uniref:bifunctional acetate--CoA ligase family protein/GNAT family N-acetyltransferase n=1 Tax=Rhabdothermincola sediminis TaxID=2751370 RepID=UPI001AA04DF5|nr:GNAT family N-acetyltransferase [Rhabdothermincola sediminis]